MKSLPSTLTMGWRRGRIEIHQFLRQPESVIFTLLFPLILMAIFGSVFRGKIAHGVTLSQYFLAGMIASGLINSGFQQLAISFPLERDDGSLIGKTILVLASIIFQVFFLLLGGTLFFNIHLPSAPAKWLTIVSPLAIILQFFSGVFFVFTQLPHWMQQFASVFPLKWLCQGIRSVFLPDAFAQSEVAHSWETGRTLLVLTIWLILGLVISIRTFKWNRE